jgi:hypothetical protein
VNHHNPNPKQTQNVNQFEEFHLSKKKKKKNQDLSSGLEENGDEDAGGEEKKREEERTGRKSTYFGRSLSISARDSVGRGF